MTRLGDKEFMQLACQLARQGQGYVEPNPMVGCVLVRDGQIIGQGYHQRFGGPHAERVALSSLPEGAARGATAYVTLEPCCHHGKTPPCTDALIAAGVARVCCAMLDPFDQVSGRGVALLREAGIEVDILPAEQSSAAEVLAPYLKRITTGLPYVIAKWAMSLDGKMATRTGDSRWISGPESRAHAHQTRGRMDAIVVGSRTAQLDDPLLTARPAGPRTPLRVVLDSRASLRLESQLVESVEQAPVLVWTGPEAAPQQVAALRRAGCRVECWPDQAVRMAALMKFLVSEYRATNVLVEGGGQLLGHLFDQGLIDEYHVYIAPKILGGAAATNPCSAVGLDLVSRSPQMRIVQHQSLGPDIFLQAR